MNKEKKYIEIGLTQDELVKAVQGAGDPSVLDGLESKLENCDLSRPSIELVNSEDLNAVLEISNGINNKYVASSYGAIVKKSLLAGVALFFIGIGTYLMVSNSNNPIVETAEVVKVVIPSGPQDEVKEVHKEDTIENLDLEQNNVEQPIENVVPQEANIDLPIAKNIVDTVLKEKVELESKSEEKIEEGEKEKIELPKAIEGRAPKRIVRGVIVNGMIDDKYKGDSYKINDLVDFQGGNEQLQKEIYSLLKSKVKDDDIPKSSSTIVFNFEVSSRGNVKKVSVQSRTTPELEAIIIQSISELDTWNKGSKRASKNYSVFVTFK